MAVISFTIRTDTHPKLCCVCATCCSKASAHGRPGAGQDQYVCLERLPLPSAFLPSFLCRIREALLKQNVPVCVKWHASSSPSQQRHTSYHKLTSKWSIFRQRSHFPHRTIDARFEIDKPHPHTRCATLTTTPIVPVLPSVPRAVH